MKNRIFLIFCLLAFLTTAAQAVDELTVTEVKGKVTYMTNKGQRLPLEVSDIVDGSTVINIPYHGALVLADRTANKKYSITAPGRAPVSVLLKDTRNTVENLTKDYMKTVLAHLTKDKSIKPVLVTQPAAITRKMETVKKSGMDMDTDFDLTLDLDLDINLNFSKQDLINEYRNFRDNCLQTYVNCLRETWKSYSGEDPKKIPEVKEVPPMFIPIKDDGEEGEPISYDQAMADGLKGEVATTEDNTNSWFSYIGNIVKGAAKDAKKKAKAKNRPTKQLPVEKVHKEVVEEKPKVVKAPVPVASVPGGAGVNTLYQFTAFGTTYQVRLNDQCKFTLNSVSENAIADAVDNFRDMKYDNLLHDCLVIRKENQLSDWAYYEVLRELTNQFCGKGTNESVLLLGYLYSQSGYKLRIGRDDNKLMLLLASQHTIYNKVGYILDGTKYYLIDSESKNLRITGASFPNETGLSLAINKVQKFDYKPSPTRTIRSRDYPDFKVTVHTNKNLLSFYDTYLRSSINNELMTQWAFYANTPIASEVREELYPQLHAYLDKFDQEEAVNRLLNLIQTGMVYKLDDEVWGGDRAFFPEETLFYPYCDCEDRSILMSRLVRDILGLKTILIYYPGHLAMAVNFTVPVSGDCIIVDGKKFFVCDPTYVAADPGRTMVGYDNKTAQVILLQ